MTTTNPTKVVNPNAVVPDTTDPKISSMEATTHVPTASRSPRPKKCTTKEKQPTAKEKKKKPVPLRMSPRNNPEVCQKERKEKWLQKVVDLEEENYQGIEDLYIEEVDPIS